MKQEVRDRLIEGAAALGIALDTAKMQQVESLSILLQDANQQLNLTALQDEEEIAVKHFLDSWTCSTLIDRSGRLVDIGAGAGFPGLALKIIHPDLEVTLVEAVQKKVRFIDTCLKTLNLKGAQVVIGRAEELGRLPKWRESFDFATCRAVGHLALIAEYCIPLLKVNGYLIAQKGKEGLKETKEAEEGIKLLGGQVQDIHRISLPGLEGHCLIRIKKNTKTPERFPRRTGIPRKRPLVSKEWASSLRKSMLK